MEAAIEDDTAANFARPAMDADTAAKKIQSQYRIHVTRLKSTVAGRSYFGLEATQAEQDASVVIQTAWKRAKRLDPSLGLDQTEDSSDDEFDDLTISATFVEHGSIGIVFHEINDVVCIYKITAGTQAAKFASLEPGLKIVSLEEQGQIENLSTLSYSDCLSRIRACGRPVTLNFLQYNPDFEPAHEQTTSDSQHLFQNSASSQQFITIECPDGAQEGSILEITTQDGQNVEIQVPAGVQPGEQFEVFLGTNLLTRDQSVPLGDGESPKHILPKSDSGVWVIAQDKLLKLGGKMTKKWQKREFVLTHHGLGWCVLLISILFALLWTYAQRACGNRYENASSHGNSEAFPNALGHFAFSSIVGKPIGVDGLLSSVGASHKNWSDFGFEVRSAAGLISAVAALVLTCPYFR